MRKKFFILVFLSTLLLILEYFNLSSPITFLAEPLITGTKRNIYQGVFNFRHFPEVVFNYEKITTYESEKQRYVNENRQFKLKLANLEKENADLRRQLDAPMPPTFRFIPADVIAVSRSMEINAGLLHGVAKDMIVVDGITLIGRVSKVTQSRAQVTLLSDSDLIVPAITSRGSRGNLTGQLSEFSLFKDVLQKDPLFLEDILVTTGEGGYPKELLLGTVVRIDSDDVAVYKQAQIKPFSNPALLKKVFVTEES